MPALRVLVLSEDGSDHAHEVVVALAKSMLKIVDAAVQTQRERLQFDEERGDARRAMRANLWRSQSEEHEPFIRALMRAIVRQLLVVDDDGRPSGFVFFHYDGDEAFSNRGASDARRHFAELRVKIEQQVRAAGVTTDEAVGRVMRRLVAVEPFYCIEAWTYQHTEAAKKICARRCGKHTKLFEAWAGDRGALDEITKPWSPEQLDCCLGKENNVGLVAAGYPAADVWGAGKSFYETVDRMCECPDLVEAVARTYMMTTQGSK
jgi:hypothetical protein